MPPAKPVKYNDAVSDHQECYQIQGIRRRQTIIGIMAVHVKQIMSEEIAKNNDPAKKEQNQMRLIDC